MAPELARADEVIASPCYQRHSGYLPGQDFETNAGMDSNDKPAGPQ